MTEDRTAHIVLRDIDIGTAYEDFAELIREHWQEVAVYKDKVALSIDWDYYETLYDAGRVLMLGAYDISRGNQNRKPVGYILDVLGNNPHYSDDVFAANDVIYVDPRWRRKGLGERLITVSERKLATLGVTVRTLHIKVLQDFGNMAEGLGYGMIETVRGKYLGG